MKAGKTINELAQTITAQRDLVRDYRLPQKFLRMNPDDLTVRTDTEQTTTALTIKPSRLMHDQLAERLGIPARYYQKMMTEAPRLLAANVNEWFTRGNGEKRLLRTFQPQMLSQEQVVARRLQGQSDATIFAGMNQPLEGRAFLGGTYRPLDNYDLVTALVPPMLDAGVEIASSEVTDSRLYIQAVSHKIEARVVNRKAVDDVVRIGLVAQNSEVGCGSLNIRALLWRKVCTNGLIVSEDLPGFKQVHIGRLDSDVSGAILSTDTKRLADAALWSKASDVIKSILAQSTLDTIVSRLNAIAAVELANPEKAVELVAERFDLVEDERAAVMKNLISGGDVSQWGLTNAVTALANTVASYDRAIELETIGGKVAGLPAQVFGNN